MCDEAKLDEIETEHRHLLTNVAYVFSKMCQRKDDFCPLGLEVNDGYCAKTKNKECPILGESSDCCLFTSNYDWVYWLEQYNCMR